MEEFIKNIDILKALSHPIRAKIVKMISYGEVSASTIIQSFDLSQSTISHHMKILCESGIVNARSESKWTYYRLNKDAVNCVNDFITGLTSSKEDK